jgi:hypothetical protein
VKVQISLRQCRDCLINRNGSKRRNRRERHARRVPEKASASTR